MLLNIQLDILPIGQRLLASSSLQQPGCWLHQGRQDQRLDAANLILCTEY